MISIGKALGISRCASREGVFFVLALDHRNNLRLALNPSSPETVTYESVASLKANIVHSLIGSSSALLLDAEYGLNREILRSIASGRAGVILSVEETGYTGKPTERVSSLLENWGVEKIKRTGADAVKLLLYYHPFSKSASLQEEFVRLVSEQCLRYDIPLFLEILTHSVDPQTNQLSSAEKMNSIAAAIEKFNDMPVDLYKLEFPFNVDQDLDESEWEDACKFISSKARFPWLLLSAGVNFEMFVRQTEIACRAGASGVMAGRAIWQEALLYQGEKKERFLTITAPERMEKLARICRTTAKPWTDFFQLPDLAQNWYSTYAGFY